MDFDLSVKELAEILTDTGLEVEGIKRIDQVQGGLDGLVVGKVTECKKHSDADRLKITQVDVGSESLQIVCGAPNVDVGQNVIIALVGSTLYPEPDKPFKIKKAKIRGVASFGMICAEDEMGLGKSHDGILILENHARIGQKASEYFNLSSDYQLEIGLTPNRCDAMGHIGVARDIKAFLNFHRQANLELKLPKTELPKSTKKNLIDLSIEINESDLCPKYIGAIVNNVKIAPSPEWLQQALTAIDIEPINNIVDITNFVMFEYGTPLHAFDYSKVGDKIVVKKGEKNDVFKTLDGVDRKLTGEELMITNGTENLCIAGVYGGMTSGISETCTSVFLESALFNSTSVRKTAKAHGLQTDASFRFERGVDPTFTEMAMRRALSLILEISGGELIMNPKSVLSSIEKSTKIQLNTTTLNSRLGIQIEIEQIIDILENLDFICEKSSNEDLLLTVPSYRRDVYRSEDVMEEVLRIYGFNQVPIPKKWHISFQNNEYENTDRIERTLSNWFVSNGFNEVVNNSLSKDLFSNQKEEGKEKVAILNPLSSELAFMRTSLLFGMLENIKHNQNRQQNNLKLFEFGKVYQKSKEGYHETRQLAFVITGNQKHESWRHQNESVDFFILKEVCQTVREKLGLKLKEADSTDSLYFDSAQQLNLKNEKVIEYGEVSNEIKKKIGFKGLVYAGVLNIDLAMNHRPKSATTFKELPKTFFVKRDFSLILDKSVSYASIQKIAKDSEQNLLKSINLFDVYEGNKLPENKKSYAVSFVFQHHQDTLQDAQIDLIMEKIRARLQKELGAELRA